MGATSVTGVGYGNAIGPGDGRTHYISNKLTNVTESNSVWLETPIKFNKVDFNEIKENDIVYYQIFYAAKRYRDDVAHGPFLVVEKWEHSVRLRNKQGVEFSFKEDGLQYLKVDLISLITGGFTA